MAYPCNIDTWDPMADSYHDANINSYEHGPGVNLTPYARVHANTEYKLYVSEIPSELDESGIREIFNQYGKTVNVMSPAGASWAFVTYGSFREAERAIRVLNSVPPLNLSITFSKKKENDPIRKQTRQGVPNIESLPVAPVLDNQHKEFISPGQLPQYTKPLVRNLGRGKELAALARRSIAPPPGPRYYDNEDLLYPHIHDPNIYDPYEEDSEAFADTNNMWARGRLQVSNNGSRYVTMGRGCTWYELPTPHPRVNEQIRAVYKSREDGAYEYGQNKLAQQIGKCQYCYEPATKRCQRCQEFYCSRSCQEADWLRHKIECQPIPNLEGEVDSGSLSISSGEEVAQQGLVKRSIRKLRRPIASAALPTAPNCTSTPLTGTPPKSGMPTPVPQNTLEPTAKEKEPFSSQDNLKRNHSGDQKTLADQNKACNAGGWNPVKTGENQAFRRYNSCSDGSNISQQACSVNRLPLPLMQQDTEPRGEPSKNQNAAGSNQRSNAQQCGPTNRNFYNRVGHENSDQRNYQQVTSQVKNLRIIDTETAKSLRKPALPDPDFSFHRAADMHGTSDVKSISKVSFKQTATDIVATASGNQSTFNVVGNDIGTETHAEIGKEPRMINSSAVIISPAKAPTSAPKKEQKNVVECLDAEEEGCFEAHVLLGGNKAAVTVCVLKFQTEYAKISSELTPECDKMQIALNVKPQIGDFVCGKRLDDWIRGTVTSLGPPIRLAAVDEGRMEPVTSVKPIPQEFVSLPTLGAICELTEGSFKLQSQEQYTFVVVDDNPGNISEKGVEIIIFSTDDREGKGFLKPWTPAPEQKGIPYASLTSGTEVYIVSFRSHALLCARSLVPKDMELFNRVTQDVAQWSTQATKFNELPLIGEMVIAKYAEDGNFYRAIVRQIKNTKITVSYVDFGNIETTTLDNIRLISPKLKECPSCVAKIILKDVPKDVAMTKEVNNYLGMLAGMEKPLMCTFSGSPSIDGVILEEANGTCVNDKIKNLLTPSWKKEEEDKNTTAFMIGDLEVAELGTVGDTINVLVLFSYGPLMHAMAPQDMELIGHITGVMAAQMEEYCKHAKDHYIPRQDELCLAPYEGLWYRAVCLEPNTTSTTSTVNFIDFGNIDTIPHTDLRLMNKDFMDTKTLTSVCTVVGLGSVDKDGDLPLAVEARVKELVPHNSVTLVKIVECTKPGEYVVELPEIRDTLIKEGLLKL